MICGSNKSLLQRALWDKRVGRTVKATAVGPPIRSAAYTWCRLPVEGRGLSVRSALWAFNDTFLFINVKSGLKVCWNRDVSIKRVQTPSPFPLPCKYLATSHHCSIGLRINLWKAMSTLHVKWTSAEYVALLTASAALRQWRKVLGAWLAPLAFSNSLQCDTRPNDDWGWLERCSISFLVVLNGDVIFCASNVFINLTEAFKLHWEMMVRTKYLQPVT